MENGTIMTLQKNIQVTVGDEEEEECKEESGDKEEEKGEEESGEMRLRES
jgi:hypothetical protein